MKSGVRALGVAESYREDRSTLAGAVVRADRVVDGFGFISCTVGGTDATDAVVSLVERVAREDIRYIMLGAVAPAWYNVLDLSTVHQRTDRPVLAVTFEESDGLEAGLHEAFSGPELEARLERYRNLPPRRAVSVGEETVYVRACGLEFEEAREIVRGFTPEGGRPEPLRVARLAARAGAKYRREEE
ncbi:endonuclease dU [Natrialbaceae archaeon A-gly3]